MALARLLSSAYRERIRLTRTRAQTLQAHDRYIVLRNCRQELPAAFVSAAAAAAALSAAATAALRPAATALLAVQRRCRRVVERPAGE